MPKPSSLNCSGSRPLPVLIGVLAVAGCSGQPTVTGSVTLDGKPLQSIGDVRGSVVFSPLDSGAPPARASIDENGRYDVFTGSKRGVAPGEYGVTVNAIRVIPPAVEGSEPGAERLLPAKYGSPRTSGLSLSVTPGSNSFDIALESAPKKR